MKFRSGAVFLAGALALTSVNADVQTINHCTVIHKPGSYRLQKVIVATQRDLQPATLTGGLGVAACIIVDADFVTLDLQGFSIIGPGTPLSVGIFAPFSSEDFKVHSGIVTNFDFGILSQGTGRTVENIRASRNGIQGINVGSGGNGHRVIGNTANQNGESGIVVQCPSLILGNMATGNGTFDIFTSDDFSCTRSHNSPRVGDLP